MLYVLACVKLRWCVLSAEVFMIFGGDKREFFLALFGVLVFIAFYLLVWVFFFFSNVKKLLNLYSIASKNVVEFLVSGLFWSDWCEVNVRDNVKYKQWQEQKKTNRKKNTKLYLYKVFMMQIFIGIFNLNWFYGWNLALRYIDNVVVR